MYKKIVSVILCMIILSSFLPACNSVKYSGSGMKDPKGLDSKIVMQMRRDYRKHLIKEIFHFSKLEDIWVQQYFGNFSGCEVVYMGSNIGFNEELRPVEIAEYTIVFRDGREVYAYKNSRFYTLKEAYDKGFLTKEDIYEIGKLVGSEFAEQYPNP